MQVFNLVFDSQILP